MLGPPHKGLHPQPRRSRLPLLAALVVAALCVLLLSAARRAPGSGAEPVEDLAAQFEADSRWPKVRTIRGLETLWQVPPGGARGALFVAHGCSHQGSDFFSPGPACPACLGLPEERLVRLAALRRGYAVVAVTSYDRDSKCWQNRAPSKSEDLKRLPAILREVLKEEGLWGKVPLYTFGASSGGGIALRLAALMPEVQGVICQINPVNPGVFTVPQGRTFPPTIFVHMAQRDPEKAKLTANALSILKDQGTPGAEIKVAPRPLTPDFLRRSPAVSAPVAAAIVAGLREGGYLNEDGYLLSDPRSGAHQWRELLKPVVGELSLEPDVSHVAELLNLAYARHEIISDHTEACLAWLEAGGALPVERLLE